MVDILIYCTTVLIYDTRRDLSTCLTLKIEDDAKWQQIQAIEVLVAIDKRRMEIAQLEGIIPTRSDVVRAALENYLGIKVSDQ